MEDIFEIQERVAKDIAAGMSLKLSPTDELKIEERITKNTVAYEPTCALRASATDH